MSKVLFFGPYPLPITGQSIAFKEVFTNFKGDKILVNSTKFKDNKILNTIYCLCLLPLVFISRRFDKVYFTCSRSYLGFLKDFLLLFLCKLFNKKVVNHLHGADFDNFYINSGKLKPLIKWSYNKIDSTIILLPSMRSQFVSFPKMNIEIVRNSYPSEFEDVLFDLNDKNLQILYLSNLMESKGILIFMESIKQILENHPLVVVKIAGAPMGDYLASSQEIKLKFEKHYKSLKKSFPNRLFYIGVIIGLEKQKVLTESSIFILPTFYKTEASPITIIEAMRFGNAIIATNHNYLNDIVNDRNGFLVKIKSVIDLTEKINLLLFNKTLLKNIQKNNILEAKANYSPKTFNSEIARIITSL
jgi:glycosyltransferase involved in cell wall biosynthesis